MKIVNRSSHVLEVALLPYGESLSWIPTKAIAEGGGGRLRWKGGVHQVRAVWIGQGWPSEVLRHLSTLKSSARDVVVTADRFSDESIRLLRKERLNFADLGGNLSLSIPSGGLFLERAGTALPSLGVRRNRGLSSWSKAEMEIAELLLLWHQSHRDGGPIRLNDMDDSTVPALWGGWSKPMISNCFRQFTEYEWLERHGPPRGIGVWWQLVQPGALLEALAASRSSRSPLREDWFSQDHITNRLAEILDGREELDRHDWAITGWHALDHYAPLFPHSLKLQVCVWTEAWEQVREVLRNECQLVPHGEGNLEIWREDLHINCKQASFVNPIKLHSDLLLLEGRGPQAASHLRSEVLKI